MVFVKRYGLMIFGTLLLQINNIYSMTFFLERLTYNTWQCVLLNIHKKQQENKQSLDLFLQKYTPPKAVVAFLSADNDELFKKCLAHRCPKQIMVENKLYWIKVHKSIERIVNAIRLKELIVRKNLTRLDVAKKYIHYNNNKWLTITEHVERDYTWYSYDKEHDIYVPKKSFFDDEIAKQLSSLTIHSGFIDWSSCQNFIIDQNKKIVFIDTEDRTFFDYKKHIKNRPYACHMQVLSRMVDYIPFDRQTNGDMWVEQYVKNELKQCEADNVYCKENKITLLPCNSNLDPADFDLYFIKDKLMHCKKRNINHHVSI